MSLYCAQCGFSLRPDDRFCQECGAPVVQKTVSKGSNSKRVALITCFSVLFVLGLTALILYARSYNVRKAKEYLAAEMVNQAIALLEKEVEERPTNAEAHFLLGKSYLFERRIKAAEESLNRAMHLNPAYEIEAVNNLLTTGKKFLEGQEHEVAWEAFRLAQSLDPSIKREIGEIYVRKAKEYLDTGMTAQAIALLEKETDERPTNAEAYFLLGKSYLSGENIKAATGSLNRAILLRPAYKKETIDNLLATGKRLLEGQDHKIAQEVFRLAYSLDPSTKKEIGEIHFESRLKLIPLSIETVTLRRTFRVAGGSVTTAALSNDGKLLAAGSTAGTIIIWDVESGGAVNQMNLGSDVTSIVFSPGDHTLAVTSFGTHRDKGKILIWDLEKGRTIALEKGSRANSYNDSMFMNIEPWLIVRASELQWGNGGRSFRTLNNWIEVWDLEKKARVWESPGNHNAYSFSVRLQQIVAYDNKEEKINIYGAPEAEEGEEEIRRTLSKTDPWRLTHSFKLHPRVIYMALSSDSSLLGVTQLEAEARYTIAKLLDLAGAEFFRLMQIESPFYFHPISFSPSGKLLAIGKTGYLNGKWDPELIFWNVEAKKEVRRLKGYGEVAFPPSERLMATWGAEKRGEIDLWW